MKTLKIMTAIILIAMTAFFVSIQAFAVGTFSYADQAQTLNDLGLYKGISEETFDPDLGTALNRETGVVMLLRIFGLEAAALAIADADADAVLAKFSDAAAISSWAKLHVAYAVDNGLVQGLPDGSFGPKQALVGKAYCTLILRQLGYTPNYDGAPAELVERGGLTAAQGAAITDKALIKDDLVGISFGSLSATDKEGVSVIETLVTANIINMIDAMHAGLIESDPKALDIKSAKMISSKTVEIFLNTPASITDLVADKLTARNYEGNDIGISSISFAPWNSDKKSILITFNDILTQGKLYTVTSDSNSVHFYATYMSGLPQCLSIQSIDYNEVRVTFDKAINLENTSFHIYQKNGGMSELIVRDESYLDSNTITLSTAEQAANTLYEVIAYGIGVFDGNVMVNEVIGQFVGISRNTDTLKLESAFSNEPDTVLLKFNVNVDRNEINETLFKVEVTYGTREIKTVTVARAASEGDLDEAGIPLSFDTAKKYIILTVRELKKVNYKVSTSGLKSIYGMEMSLNVDDTYKTFVGMEKPRNPFTFTVMGGIASNNTTVLLEYQNKVNSEMAENLSNYSIAEAYGSKAALAISKVELVGTSGKIVALTTGSMKNVLYKLNISNVNDLYGNQLLTSDGANIVTFVGKGILPPISSIISIQANSSNSLIVEFDQNIGDGATDITNYRISGGVVYLRKATKIGDKQVLLDLIGTTSSSYIYTLNVRGFYNSDGVAMGLSIRKAFPGYYIAPVEEDQQPAAQCTVQAAQQNGQALELSEANLNGAVIRLTIANDVFILALDTQNFESFDAPTGTTISEVDRIDDTHADIQLTFDGTDFDSDINSFAIKIKPQGLVNAGTATTPSISITATDEIIPGPGPGPGPGAAANDILAYDFFEYEEDSVVSSDLTHTYDIFVYKDADISHLIAAFTLSPGASAYIEQLGQPDTDQISEVTVNDFSNPQMQLIYTVVSQNDESQDWVIKVNVITTGVTATATITQQGSNILREILTLTITSASTVDGRFAIILDGNIIGIPVLTTDSTSDIATKILPFIQAKANDLGYSAVADNNNVIFTALQPGAMNDLVITVE